MHFGKRTMNFVEMYTWIFYHCVSVANLAVVTMLGMDRPQQSGQEFLNLFDACFFNPIVTAHCRMSIAVITDFTPKLQPILPEMMAAISAVTELPKIGSGSAATKIPQVVDCSNAEHGRPRCHSSW